MAEVVAWLVGLPDTAGHRALLEQTAALLPGNAPIHAVRHGENDWRLSRVDVENVEAGSPRIAIVGEDGVHVAYWDRTLGDLKYAYRPCSP